MGHTIGLEARALNNQGGVAGLYLFTPNVNPSRDQRWGRAQEVPSEDPTVCGEYGAQFVRGFQSRNASGPRGTPLLAAATAKHWAFYDLEGVIERTDKQVRTGDTRTTHPPTRCSGDLPASNSNVVA